MGQNVEWKKRRMGQNVEWKKRRLVEKLLNGKNDEKHLGKSVSVSRDTDTDTDRDIDVDVEMGRFLQLTIRGFIIGLCMYTEVKVIS